MRRSTASAGWQHANTSLEPVVGNRGHLVLLADRGASSSRRPSSSVFRASVRSRRMRSIARFRAVVTIHAALVARRAVAGPLLERGREGVLHRVLGELEVAEDADQDRDRAAPFLPEQGLDGHSCSTSGLISTEPVSATGILDATSIAWSRSSHSATK